MNDVLLPIKRMLIRDKEQDFLLRIVFIDHLSELTWLCRIDDNSWPYSVPSHQLREDMDPASGRYTIEHNDPWMQPTINPEKETASEKHKRQNYTLIEPLISGENGRLILSRRNRKSLIDVRLTEVNTTRQTLVELLLRYWKRGMTYEALRPDYMYCGARGKQRDPKGKKLGAPRIISPGTGINVDENIRKIFRIGADFYNSRKKPTMREAYDYIIGKFYYTKINDNAGEIIGTVKVEKPTERQFQYYIKTHFTYRHIRQKRNGVKQWELKEREILGVADADVLGPGDRFEIDATVADVYLVSQFDRRRIVGRPIIYFAIDVFSRLIVGVYVGFEGPSWLGAMMVLVNTVTPKIEFCKQYDINIDESDWPSHYAPRCILADRGELMSVEKGENITRYLGIEIDNTSPGRADLKAIVERRFGIVPAKYKQFVPGYVQQDFGDRGARDYRLDAALNLREFTQMVIYAVLKHNLTPIRDIKLPPKMITEGLSANPLDFWRWGIVNRSGALNILTVDEVALNVMPTDRALVTEKGIKFKNLYYSCPTAQSEDWFAQARRQHCTVNISYDPRDLGIMYIRDSSLPNKFESCHLLDHCNAYQGKSLYEVEELDADKKLITAAGEDDRQSRRIFFDQQAAKIEKNAKQEKKAVIEPDISKSQQIKAIRNNRAVEKEIQRSAEAFVIEDSTTNPVSHTSTTSSIVSNTSNRYKTNALLLLKKQRAENDGNNHD
ncbi:MAG: hypothetical protein CXR31_10115 [Geobacter sp.]|nr:MAG: hypothetical protein CXR31_10115 [Geobacter sp.]